MIMKEKINANKKEERKVLIIMIMRTEKNNANDKEEKKVLTVMIMVTGKY
jgi:hypothetical protein